MNKTRHPLYRYRKSAKVSLTDFAARIGVEKSTISRIENGHRRPSAELAARIRKATGIPASDLRPDLAAMFREAAA